MRKLTSGGHCKRSQNLPRDRDTVFVLLPTTDRQKNKCVTLKEVKVETATRRESESKNK